MADVVIDDEGTPAVDMEQGVSQPQEPRKQSIQRCIQSLVHANQCRGTSCQSSSCRKMKRVVKHPKICKRKTKGGCKMCKQVIALCCYHAENLCPASVTECSVPFCTSIKHKLKLKQQNPAVPEQPQPTLSYQEQMMQMLKSHSIMD